jgi:hypothetical protein
MYQILSEFYQDEGTREAVRQYFLNTLDRLALEKVYAKEDTQGIADARHAIETAFDDLDDMVQRQQPKPEVKTIR